MKTARTTIVLLASLLVASAASAQVNLVPNQPAGWAWPLVPRPTNDATSTSVPAPTSLAGDATATYLNSAWRNAGAAASGTFRVRNRAREAELRALWRARARRLGLDPRATERVFAAVLASSRPQKKNGRA